MKGFAWLLSLLAVAIVQADEWKSTLDGTLYGYANHLQLNESSVVNPGNQIARLPERTLTTEARLWLSAGSGRLRFSARPIALISRERNDFGDEQSNEAYLSQWQARLRGTESITLSAGREILNWGAGQFRSPSSPFYFDNGRNNPMRELSGMDAQKLTWTPSVNTALMFAHVSDSGHMTPPSDPWRDSWLLKWDQRGAEWASGLVVAKAEGSDTFIGAHLQQTLTDAWLLYGEAGSGMRTMTLISPSDSAQPFQLQSDSQREGSGLMGAAYTFESGQTLYAELLHNTGGYRRAELAAYFDRAAASPMDAGLALSVAPRLLNRNYLHLVWQSNLMAEEGYVQAMVTHNLDDGGNEVAGYAENTLTPHISAFGLASFASGGARSEFSRIYTRSVTAGIKIVMP